MRNSKKTHILLWTIQFLLAALFLFAGVTKFMIPDAQLTANSPLSAGFIHFIGVAEIAGALGLILPGLTHIGSVLTLLAATGLVIIMIGATTLTFSTGLGALVPFIVGVLCAFIAWGRSRDTVAA